MSEHEPGLRWRTSSRCTDDHCVEVAVGSDTVYVRNSRNASSGNLEFDFHEWTAFLGGVRNNEFDVPPGRGVVS
ncbi:DUF397 domain-containing protein [Catenulispora sp. GP43]|uniref:DUF397 domain-containing protein n=1 Tax=Catenulispora sp. GP43 TaxID=3156263 RepID=UPI003512C182